MKNKILLEFKRLQEAASTPEGWQKISDDCLTASNYHRERGRMVQVGGYGDGVLGFAIDPITWRTKIGKKGESHIGAYYDLVADIDAELRPSISIFRIEERVLKGYVIPVPGWAYPFVTLADAIRLHRRDPRFLKLVEYQILSKGIGLPMSELAISKEVRQKV